MIKYLKGIFYSLIFRIGFAMHKVEDEMKEVSTDSDPNKQEQKLRNQNPLLLKMEQGQKDEKYVKDFYEVLKKADHFMKHASEQQIQMAAEKNGMTYGKKDRWGRRFEHYGFYDPKSKHYGKTMAEAIESQVSERKTNDDEFAVLFMINNEKRNIGLARLNDIEETKNGLIELKNELVRKREEDKKIIVIRDKDSLNKIEQLTEFMHVKQVTSKHRILEFFIDKKYKVFEQSEDSEIFKEIVGIKQVWFSDEWGNKYGYTVTGYRKRIDFDSRYEVIKLNAIEIEKL